MHTYLSDKSTIIWFIFTIYIISAVFLLPNRVNWEAQSVEIDAQIQQPLKFASRFIFRITLIFPMLILLQNAL